MVPLPHPVRDTLQAHLTSFLHGAIGIDAVNPVNVSWRAGVLQGEYISQG